MNYHFVSDVIAGVLSPGIIATPRRAQQGCKYRNCHGTQVFSNAFGIADGAHLGRKIALLPAAIVLTATVDLGARDGIRKWLVLGRLIMNPANDGDNFHASAGDRNASFRLYLVDARRKPMR